MQQFFNEYRDKPKLQPLVGEISWSKNLLIMARCKDDLEREFYLRATARFGWTKSVLQHQLDNHSYRHTCWAKPLMLPCRTASNPSHAGRQRPLHLRLCGPGRRTFRTPAGTALVRNLRSFLNKMGGAFTFVGNQYRLEVDGKDYFIDLLLFHRRLCCLVAIELKIGDFKPEHKGQIEFYLDTLDQQHRLEGENPPIGIVICRSKTKTVVEYALRTAVHPLEHVHVHRHPATARQLPGRLAQPR